MKNFCSQHKWKIAAILCVSVFVLAATIQPWRTRAVQPTDEADMFARLQDGLGAGAPQPAINSSQSQSTSAVNSAATFIYGRSGVQINQNVKTALASLEYAVLNGTRRRITPAELSNILTKVLLQRVDLLTNTEIKTASQQLRVVPDWQPSTRANEVQIRRSQGGELSPTQFATNFRAFRDQSTDAAILWRAAAGTVVAQVVSARLTLFSNAVPSQWGGVVSNGVTPLQAFLVAYSAASDDPLCDSSANLQGYLDTLYTDFSASYTGLPSPQNRFAFGSNGYWYASPLNIMFNDSVMQAIVDSIDEGSTL